MTHKITWDSFEFTHELGHGGFGYVFLGELKHIKAKGIVKKYAVKCIQKDRLKGASLLKCIQLERNILHDAHSDFISKLHFAFRDDYHLYLALDYAQGGDTYSLFCKHNSRFSAFKKAGEDAVRFILACVILGLEYLHKHHIMYRDLKPENMLIYEDGYVKLADFGLAKIVKKGDKTTSQSGSPLYFAPEVVDKKKSYSKEIDLWALGIYAYELSNYEPPFEAEHIQNYTLFRALVKRAEKFRVWKDPYLSP